MSLVLDEIGGDTKALSTMAVTVANRLLRSTRTEPVNSMSVRMQTRIMVTPIEK
jgi:hypothetical protein